MDNRPGRADRFHARFSLIGRSTSGVVTSPEPLWTGDDLMARQDEWTDHGVQSVARVGDCLVSASIADAVYRGHRYARELEEPAANQLPKRERPAPLSREGVAS